MIRTVWVVFSAFCVAIMMSEALALGFFWSQGQLTGARLREMRVLLGPQEKEAVVSNDETRPVSPSTQDVLRDRSLRVLSLSSLETEVGLLKTMLENERSHLTADQQTFQRQKIGFVAELSRLSDETLVAAREQARGILLALPPTSAADKLMQLTVEDDVLLIRDMPEAQIARILKEFSTPPETPAQAGAAALKEVKDRQQRAKEIFERIVKGEPRGSIIREALNRVQQAQAERPEPSTTK